MYIFIRNVKTIFIFIVTNDSYKANTKYMYTNLL